MSTTVETTAAIWDTDICGRHKLVLLALADLTSEFSTTSRYIGTLADSAIESLAEQTDMSPREFARTLVELEEEGVLEHRHNGMWFRL